MSYWPEHLLISRTLYRQLMIFFKWQSHEDNYTVMKSDAVEARQMRIKLLNLRAESSGMQNRIVKEKE